MAKTEIKLTNKKISFVKVQEGDYKKKVWDKEQKKLVQTEELHHWKLQTFTIDLGTCGREKLGFIKVEYWGEKPIIEGQYIDTGIFYLKQKKWTKKDPHTFIEKKMSEVILVMEDFNFLREEDKFKKYNEKKNLTPEQSQQEALKEYYADKYGPDVALASSEDDKELVFVNDAFLDPEIVDMIKEDNNGK